MTRTYAPETVGQETAQLRAAIARTKRECQDGIAADDPTRIIAAARALRSLYWRLNRLGARSPEGGTETLERSAN
jgi:hypothetical protein